VAEGEDGRPLFHAPAEGYDRYIGRYGPSLASELIAFAGVERGSRALDVGCGPGPLAAALAERLGGSNVVAVDPSEPFAAACRERVPQSEVVVAAAESLPFEDGSFDATLSQLVVNFMSNPEAGVREMARVTAPSGIVASCVWDYAGGMTMLRAFWDAAREVDPEGGAAADEDDMPWCGEGELADLWRSVGLEDVRFGALTAQATYDGFDDLWSGFLAGIGPGGAFTASLDDERRAVLRDAFRRRLGVGDDPFELTARAWAVSGVAGA
jgi:SAM-dependent methyltransferase